MSRRLSVLLIVPVVLCLLFIFPFAAPVSAIETINVAVCFDPNEILNPGGNNVDYFVDRIQDGNLGGFYQLIATPVTYDQVAAGALMDMSAVNGALSADPFDVAYIWGGYGIVMVAVLPEILGQADNGFGDELKAFVDQGGGLVAHCGAALAISLNMKTLFFIRIPALGIFPMDASVEINQLLNLIGRAIVSLGADFLAPVSVEFNDSSWRLRDPLYDYMGGLDPLPDPENPFLRNYMWDGGVSYSRWTRGNVKVHATVASYDVHERFAQYNQDRPFFLSSTYGAGKVMVCPGSPELAGGIGIGPALDTADDTDATVSEILRAEIFYVWADRP